MTIYVSRSVTPKDHRCKSYTNIYQHSIVLHPSGTFLFFCGIDIAVYVLDAISFMFSIKFYLSFDIQQLSGLFASLLVLFMRMMLYST